MGYSTVKPITQRPSDDSNRNGTTIASAITTLWVMGLKDEYNRAKNWFTNEFINFDYSNVNTKVEVITSYYIGGLLSSSALTGDVALKEAALQLAQTLKPAYASGSGLPLEWINPYNKAATGSIVTLESIGKQLLENAYLAKLKSRNEQRLDDSWKFIETAEKINGLYYPRVDVSKSDKKIQHLDDRNLWTQNEFLFNLLKSFIQSGGTDSRAIKLFREGLEAVERNQLISMNDQMMFYAEDYRLSMWTRSSWFAASGCQLGAMYALGASVLNQFLLNKHTTPEEELEQQRTAHQANRYWQLAEEIADTCYQLGNRTATGLMPDWTHFGGGFHQFKRNYLGPHLAESYFILWRLTRDQKYRHYAWQMVQTIEQQCRTENGGYSVIRDVHGGIPADKQPEELFITLKYLYLTFTPDSVLPLDQWVFSSAGHPLPICGANSTYPIGVCKN